TTSVLDPDRQLDLWGSTPTQLLLPRRRRDRMRRCLLQRIAPQMARFGARAMGCRSLVPTEKRKSSVLPSLPLELARSPVALTQRISEHFRSEHFRTVPRTPSSIAGTVAALRGGQARTEGKSL